MKSSANQSLHISLPCESYGDEEVAIVDSRESIGRPWQNCNRPAIASLVPKPLLVETAFDGRITMNDVSNEITTSDKCDLWYVENSRWHTFHIKQETFTHIHSNIQVITVIFQAFSGGEPLCATCLQPNCHEPAVSCFHKMDIQLNERHRFYLPGFPHVK